MLTLHVDGISSSSGMFAAITSTYRLFIGRIGILSAVEIRSGLAKKPIYTNAPSFGPFPVYSSSLTFGKRVASKLEMVTIIFEQNEHTGEFPRTEKIPVPLHNELLASPYSIAHKSCPYSG